MVKANQVVGIVLNVVNVTRLNAVVNDNVLNNTLLNFPKKENLTNLSRNREVKGIKKKYNFNTIK